jgi:hypothetical protein
LWEAPVPVTVVSEKEVRMNESIQRYRFSAGAQSSTFVGTLFSCLTGILVLGAPLELAVDKLISVQPMFLSEFIGWLLFFSGGAFLAAVGAWCGYLVTSGSQPARFRPIVAASEIAAIVMAIAAALEVSRFPTVLGESLYGNSQPDIILFFAGVLVTSLSASVSAWRLREGLAKSLATATKLFVLGALLEAVFATAVYLAFNLVPTL